jgi:RNA polymerase sigma factor (sigma-70 family)
VEASAIQAGTGVRRARIGIGSSLLRLRSDQQLLALFRAGEDEAFRIIHDRYRARLLAYARQMLSGRGGDIEDAVQDVFVRAYAGLRASDRDLVLRAWLYRVAHNRCVDELRRPQPHQTPTRGWSADPATALEQRESLQRLVIDIGRLPEQQRSALLMRELSGMPYDEVAEVLGVSIPAVKSLLVRARLGLAQALQAREAACADIREQLAEAHGRGVRPSWMARRHLRDCPACRECRAELRASRRQLAALVPAVGPLGLLAKLCGLGGGAGAGGGTAASGGGAAAVGAGGAASGFAGVTSAHVATVMAAVVATAGGAVAIQHAVAPQSSHYLRRAAPLQAPAAVPRAHATTAAAPALRRSAALVPNHKQGVRHAVGTSASATVLAAWTGRFAPTGSSSSSISSQTPTQGTVAGTTQPGQTAPGTTACQPTQSTDGSSCTDTTAPTVTTTPSTPPTTTTTPTTQAPPTPPTPKPTHGERQKTHGRWATSGAQ